MLNFSLNPSGNTLGSILDFYKRSLLLIPKAAGLLLLLFVISCENLEDHPVGPDLGTRGELVSSVSLGKFNAAPIKAQLANYQIDAEINYDIEVYKIIYKTQDAKGNIVNASGAVFVPIGKNNLSVMSLQHGTQTKKTKVGSVNVQEAFEGFIGAGLGYYTLVPDYLGLGESQGIHPYHQAKSSAVPVIDVIRAGRKEAEKLNLNLNGQIFLAGYSEGGYVTMAAHREIQKYYSGEINVTASAPMAGAYDLYNTAKIILKNKYYYEPSFLAFLIAAYNDIYGWNKLNAFFKSPYLEKIPSLFDGTKTTSQINDELTNDLSKLFKEDFINSFEAGTETDLTNAFKANGLIDWVPISPMRLFHGSADEFVPYQNSVDALNYFKNNGSSDVELITINGGTHLTAAVPSIIGAINWFETIRLKKILAGNSNR